MRVMEVLQDSTSRVSVVNVINSVRGINLERMNVGGFVRGIDLERMETLRVGALSFDCRVSLHSRSMVRAT